MAFDKKTLRARFAELQAQRATITETSAPLRKQRDDIVNKARDAEQAARKKVATAEAGLFDIDQELAMISRALRGQTAEEK